jgi:hypothetical protein
MQLGTDRPDPCITDAGYRSHNAPSDHKFKVYTSGQKRRLTPQIKREFARRAAIAPISSNITGWAAITSPTPAATPPTGARRRRL